MLLSVHHRTRYLYASPMRSLLQSLRLQPSACASQQIIEWSVSVSNGTRGASFRDGAGDLVESWSVTGPVDEVVILVTGQVQTTDTSGILRDHREMIAPAVYLRETPATALSSALIALGTEVQGATPLSLVHGLSDAVADAIRYRPGSTEAFTSAAEAMALGEGVCQDQAQALIACARLRDLPARYVSGYLHSGKDGAAHGASHAWAEIYLKGLGWVGFDPANRCCPDERYIRLGSGLDAQDAAPIRGVSRGLSADPDRERLEVAVAVQEAGQ